MTKYLYQVHMSPEYFNNFLISGQVELCKDPRAMGLFRGMPVFVVHYHIPGGIKIYQIKRALLEKLNMLHYTGPWPEEMLNSFRKDNENL